MASIFEAENVHNGHIFSQTSSLSILLDIHLLSKCDYLVCTFSSTFCRTAYEVMQTRHPDASSRSKSLDGIYYYADNPRKKVAVLPHKPKKDGELELIPGEVIVYDNDFRDGFSKGSNLYRNVSGVFPTFKVENEMDILSFPTYPEVPLKLSGHPISK